MSEGPLFPKQTESGGQEESTPVVIERSDDPNFGKTTSSRQRSLPAIPGKQGCSSSVFLLMVVGIGILALSRVLL